MDAPPPSLEDEPMDLEEIYDRYAGSLWRHALALTRHRADAEVRWTLPAP